MIVASISIDLCENGFCINFEGYEEDEPEGFESLKYVADDVEMVCDILLEKLGDSHKTFKITDKNGEVIDDA